MCIYTFRRHFVLQANHMPINFDSYKLQKSHSMKHCFGNNVSISNKKSAPVILKTNQEAVTISTSTAVC